LCGSASFSRASFSSGSCSSSISSPPGCFGESGALGAHKVVGGAVVHPAEVLVFLVALGGWWRQWRNVAWSFALALLGTIQVFSVGDLEEPGNGWLHGLHGGLVIFVVALAAYIARREARALGLGAAR